MPAVVRGGRRQSVAKAPDAKPATKSARSAGKPRSAGRKAAPGGKYRIIGSIPIPNEIIAWLAVGIVVFLLTIILMTGGRAQSLSQAVVAFADERMAAMGLNLQNIRLVGVSDEARADITAKLPFHRGQPFAFMDLGAVQKSVEDVGWVKSVTLRRQFPGTLVVTVTERPRLAVWQYQSKDTVIDDQGQIIPEARAVNFLDLPLIVGEGANESAADILELMHARPALMQKTYALVRVDTRRWDVHLKNGAIIKLPALHQDQALARLDSLIAQQRVLDQGFAEVDLLDPNALVVVPLDGHASSTATQ